MHHAPCTMHYAPFTMRHSPCTMHHAPSSKLQASCSKYDDAVFKLNKPRTERIYTFIPVIFNLNTFKTSQVLDLLQAPQRLEKYYTIKNDYLRPSWLTVLVGDEKEDYKHDNITSCMPVEVPKRLVEPKKFALCVQVLLQASIYNSGKTNIFEMFFFKI